MGYCGKSKYAWHKEDRAGRCFICKEESDELSVVRHMTSMKMVHLCSDCMVEKMSEYLLDNTRTWQGIRKTGE